MNNLSEDRLMRYLTGECSDEDFARVNAWIKESDDNARRLFRMEEVYHLGRHDSFPDQKKVARAEARLYKKLAQEDAHSHKVIRMHQWMRYAAIIVLALMIPVLSGRSDPEYDNGLVHGWQSERSDVARWHKSMAQSIGHPEITQGILRIRKRCISRWRSLFRSH